VRGGLDDALDKMARRDELRRRAAGQAAGTPPAVTELVEAVAAVVARNPELAITMGVEGAGEPVLLHFAVDDGIVQVSADNPLSAQVTDASPAAPRHADFDLEPVDDAVIDDAVVDEDVPAATYPPHPYDGTAYDEAGYDNGDTTPLTYDSVVPPSTGTEPAYQGDSGYHDSLSAGLAAAAAYDPPPTYDPASTYEPPSTYEPVSTYDRPSDYAPASTYDAPSTYDPVASTFEAPTAFSRPEPLGRRHDVPDTDRYDREPTPSPLAATPPPAIPPQTRSTAREHAAAREHALPSEQAGRSGQSVPWEQSGPRPLPMPTPMPLRHEPEATELAAKRLAAMLREDPSLLHPTPPD
jgi:hypothetical protein